MDDRNLRTIQVLTKKVETVLVKPPAPGAVCPLCERKVPKRKSSLRGEEKEK